MSDTNTFPALTIEATVFYRLSAAGQRAAVLAHKVAAQCQAITGEIAAADVDLCRVMPDGRVMATTYVIGCRENVPPELQAYVPNRDSTYFSFGCSQFTPPFGRPGIVGESRLELDTPPASAAEVMEQIRKTAAEYAAREAADKEEQKRREEKEKQDRALREMAQNAEYAACLVTMQAALSGDPAAIPEVKLPSSWNEFTWLRDSDNPVAVEIRRRRKVEAEAVTARFQAAALANAALRRAWVMRHASASAIERLNANLLADEEMERMISDYALAAFDEFPLFEDITAAETRAAARTDDDEYGCYDHLKAKWRSNKADGLSDAQWVQFKIMQAICETLPEEWGCKIEARLHEGTLDHEDVPWGVVEKMGALVTATVAGVEVRREYAL